MKYNDFQARWRENQEEIKRIEKRLQYMETRVFPVIISLWVLLAIAKIVIVIAGVK